VVTEANRLGLAAMLAADADLQVGPRFASPMHRDFHQAPDAFHVKDLKRVVADDAVVEVVGEKLVLGVLAAERKSGLGQVVGPNEKNSATLAIGSARRQARTTSIMLPNLYGTLAPKVSSTCGTISSRIFSPRAVPAASRPAAP